MSDYDNQMKGQAPPYSPPNQPGWAPPPNQAGPYVPGQAQQGGPYVPGQTQGATYVPNQGPPQQYGTQGPTFVVQQQPQPQTVVILGGCPTCRVGQLEDEFTCLGILCCICFFPLGLICLFTMREKRCTNCGATF